MDIEDFNELFDANRMLRKLELVYKDKLEDVIVEYATLGKERDDLRVLLEVSINGLLRTFAQSVAQNNAILWKAVQRYFSEDNSP